MDNETELQDSLQPEGEENTENNNEESGENKPDEVVERLSRLEKALEEERNKNKQLFERTKKAEKKVKEVKDENPKYGKDEVKEFVDLRISGYSEEEIDYIDAFARAKGMTLKEASNHDLIAGGIQAIRAKRKAQEATPDSTPKSSGGKPPKAFNQMPREDKRKYVENWRAHYQNKQRASNS